MKIFLIAMAYIAITLAIGIISNKRNKNLKHFLVAQNQLNLLLCASLLMASSYAGAYTTGSARDSYLSGFAPYLPIASMGATYLLFIPLVRFCRAMAKEGHISIPEIFSVRYDNSVKVVITVVNCIAYAAVFAVQPRAFANIVAPLLNLDATTVAWFATALMAGLALLGLTGVAWMNAIHCMTMIIGMTIISIVAMNRAGGIANIAANVDSGMWNIFAPDVFTSVAYFVSLAFNSYCASETYTIAMGAKKAKTAQWSCVIVAIVIFVFTALLMMIGISAQVLLPNLADASTTLYSLSEYLGSVFSVLACIAVLAAITSSAPAYLIYFTTIVTQEIVERMKSTSTESKKRLISSVIIIIVAFVGTYLAQRATSILDLLFNVQTVQAMSGLVLFISIYWKRVSARAALWTIALTALVGFGWIFAGNPFGIIPALIMLPMVVVLLTVFTLLEKKSISDGAQRVMDIMARHQNED